MTAILTFDDGRRLQRSTQAMTGMYALVAEAMPTGSTRLKRWLADVSQRGAPFADFALAGLDAQDRAAFWTAARAAWRVLEQRSEPGFLDDPHAHTANCLAELVAMRDDPTRGPRDETLARQPARPIDLDDRWFD